MRKELVAALADLRYISIECPNCRTRVVLDMKEKSSFAEKYRIFAPKTCPGCQQNYDSAVVQAVDGFQSTFRGEALDTE